MKNCDLTEQEQIIIDYIKKYGFVRRSTVEDILNIRKSRAGKILTLMTGKQIIKIEGASSNSKYVLYQ